MRMLLIAAAALAGLALPAAPAQADHRDGLRIGVNVGVASHWDRRDWRGDRRSRHWRGDRRWRGHPRWRGHSRWRAHSGRGWRAPCRRMWWDGWAWRCRR